MNDDDVKTRKVQSNAVCSYRVEKQKMRIFEKKGGTKWPVFDLSQYRYSREDRVWDGKAAVAERLEPGCLLQTLIILLARSRAARGVWRVRSLWIAGRDLDFNNAKDPVNRRPRRCAFLILSTLFLMSVILPLESCLPTPQILIQGRWLPFLVHNWRASTQSILWEELLRRS